MRHVFPTMGTMASLFIPGAGASPGEVRAGQRLAEVERIFADADERFSLYRPDSELSRVAAGTVSLVDASDDLLDAYAQAVDWRALTDGAFNPHRPDGVLDLNGVVKALAMRRAGQELDGAGCPNWSLVVGGDLLASGVGPDGTPWVTGIIDPTDREELLGTVTLRGSRRAIATSGNAERGDHIWLADRTTAAEFVQVTVIANDIVTADVLATAIVSGGRASLDDICDNWPVDVLAVDTVGAFSATPGMRDALGINPVFARYTRQQ